MVEKKPSGRSVNCFLRNYSNHDEPVQGFLRQKFPLNNKNNNFDSGTGRFFPNLQKKCSESEREIKTFNFFQ